MTLYNINPTIFMISYKWKVYCNSFFLNDDSALILILYVFNIRKAKLRLYHVLYLSDVCKFLRLIYKYDYQDILKVNKARI